MAGDARRLSALPAGVWALGIVSLLMDLSSELIHSLLPIFMTTVLGASMITVGLIEGVAEATAAMLKVFSGVVSDALRKRKLLLLLGYGLAALTKPLFPLAPSIAWVATARFADRVGKGIRGAPRDALVADLVPEGQRGAAYGLRQALDSIGALLGPVVAIVLLAWLAVDLRTALWIAVVPAVLAVLLIVFAVHEPPHLAREAARAPVRLADAKRLESRFWLVVALGAVLTLARFSEAFLILRAANLGLAVAWVPAVMVTMNVVYAGVSYPAGLAADDGRRRSLLLWGLGALIAADAALAIATSLPMLFVGVALWGLHMGLTQGLLSMLVAATAPPDLRGTAFGIFNLACGVALLAASVIAGALWQTLGAAATFWAGAAFTAVAMAGLAAYRPPRGR
jgi:MFS family permease